MKHFHYLPFLLLFVSLSLGCQESVSDPLETESRNQGGISEGNALLISFYDNYSNVNSFTSSQRRAISTFILAQQDIEDGKLEEASDRIDQIFEQLPISSNQWLLNTTNSHCRGCPINVGYPTAYYGLRMMDQVTDLGLPESQESLTMTAVIAPCADVVRPSLPDLQPEFARLSIDPKILEEDAQRLYLTTSLFRIWVQSITGGLKTDLIIHESEDCTSVNYFDNGSSIFTYPDYNTMIDSVPDEIASQTDLWWVIAPSGVPGDGSGYSREFVSGGMGTYGDDLPVFISDDAWFIRKPEHLGTGDYHEVELLTYHPQWFQHEFMHHLYREWSQYGLEASDHQWFDRSLWPEDFDGLYESDYFTESVTKRLLNASPSLAVGIQAKN